MRCSTQTFGGVCFPTARARRYRRATKRSSSCSSDPDVFYRMAQGASPGAAGSYQGIDLLVDLNDGLFLELKQPHPTIDLYRRELQRR